jgi:hypothetical protein
LINEIVESLISDVEWYFQGKMPEYSDIDDYFVESRYEFFPRGLRLEIKVETNSANVDHFAA